jgi:hypothetical protein
MERPYPSIEFETVAARDGRIKLPGELARRFREGEDIIVRVTLGSVDSALRRRHVDEGEIARIAGLQLEARENVIRFLKAEGALARPRGGRKAGKRS